MNTSLIAVLALLIAMVALIVRPFLTSGPVGAPLQPEPENITGRPAVPPTGAAPPAGAPASAPTVDVREQVEAAIAARKAALSPATDSVACSRCGTPAESGDAFCRKCGKKLTSAGTS